VTRVTGQVRSLRRSLISVELREWPMLSKPSETERKRRSLRVLPSIRMKKMRVMMNFRRQLLSH